MKDQDNDREGGDASVTANHNTSIAMTHTATPTEEPKVPPPPPPLPDQSRFSDEARRILKKAHGTAVNRNHRELLVPHLLLAMTMSPRARKLFEDEHADFEKVRQGCRRVLDDIPPEEEEPDAVVDTQLLKEVYVRAAVIARDDLAGEDWQVFPRHLLEAVLTRPLADKFRNLITNEWPPSAADRALAISERIEEYLIREAPKKERLGETSLLRAALRTTEALDAIAPIVKVGLVISLIWGVATIALIVYLIVR